MAKLCRCWLGSAEAPQSKRLCVMVDQQPHGWSAAWPGSTQA